MFWIDLASNALATLLGAVVGIPIALWFDRHRRISEEKERSRKVLFLVKKELHDNDESVHRWLASPSRQDETAVLHASLKDQLWRSFSDGGELQWIKDLDLLDQLSRCYHLLAAVQYLSAKYSSSLEHITTYPSFPDNTYPALTEVVLSFVNTVLTTYPVIDAAVPCTRQTTSPTDDASPPSAA